MDQQEYFQASSLRPNTLQNIFSINSSAPDTSGSAQLGVAAIV
jgi:hypothetical protein